MSNLPKELREKCERLEAYWDKLDAPRFYVYGVLMGDEHDSYELIESFEDLRDAIEALEHFRFQYDDEFTFFEVRREPREV